jgi:hypothetical protein
MVWHFAGMPSLRLNTLAARAFILPQIAAAAII